MTLDLRDIIAIEAMKTALNKLPLNNTEDALTQLATYSYKIADSMLTGRQAIHEEKFGKTIEELDLTLRTYNCLSLSGIKTLKGLSRCSENDLLMLPNLGRKALTEIIEKLKLLDLKLAN